jgi:hypothetical protein
MGAGDLLRDLDSRVLPPMARVMSRLAAGPTRLRLLTGVALLSATVVVVAAVWTVDRAPVDDPTGADLLRVGVIEGQSVPGYVRSSRGELAALLQPPSPGATAIADTYALVTLTAYFAPDRLTAVLGGVAVSEVYARAPLTGLQTQVLRIPAYRVPDDVAAGMLDVAQRRDREQADYLRLATALGDDDPRLRRAYGSAAQVASSEATAYRRGCSCVFAAVVRATPAALEQIAARPEVRAVDPAPEVRRLDRVEFIPPLPEQQTTAGEPSPPVAPLPTAAAGPQRTTRPVPAPAITESTSSPSPAVTSASPVGPGPTSEPSVEASRGRTAVPSALPASPTATTPS